MKDNQTGRSRGFGFITLTGDAEKAIAELDGKDLKGRPIRVNEARQNERPPREPREQRDFGGPREE